MKTNRMAIRSICFAFAAQSQGQWEWRASIESPGSGERQSFANLDQLSSYLREQCERQVPDPTTLPSI